MTKIDPREALREFGDSGPEVDLDRLEARVIAGLARQRATVEADLAHEMARLGRRWLPRLAAAAALLAAVGGLASWDAFRTTAVASGADDGVAALVEDLGATDTAAALRDLAAGEDS